MPLHRLSTRSVAFDLALVAAGCALTVFAPLGRETPRARVEPGPPDLLEREEAREEGARAPEERFAEAVLELRSACWPGETFGAISGTVRTRVGSPVAGASVAAYAEAKGPEARPWDAERPLEERLADLVRSSATAASTQSDADGSFQIEGLRLATPYRLEARHDRYRISAAEGINLQRVRVGQRVALVAEPLALFPVRVACFLPDGSAPPSAEISLRGPEDCQKYFRWSPEEPVIWSPCADFRIEAAASSGFLRYTSSPLDVRAGRDGEAPHVALHLRSVPGIQVRIVFPPGQNPTGLRWGVSFPVHRCSDIRVRAIPVEEPRPLPYEVWSSDLGTDAHCVSEDSRFCEYRFAGLAPGLYWVFAIVPGDWRSIAAETFVEVASDMVAADLEVSPISADRSLRLWVYGPDGRAVPEVSVSLLGANGRSWEPPAFQEDAHRWIFCLPETVLAESVEPWVLRVEAPGLGTEEVPLDIGRVRDVRVQFVEPAFLVAEVEGFRSTLYREGSVVLRLLREAVAPHESSRDRPLGEELLGRHGLAGFSAARPGKYELSFSFSPTRHVSNAVEVLRVPIRLDPGLNRVRVALPPLSLSAVRIPLERTRTELSLTPKGAGGGFSWWHGAGEAGERLSLPPLPPGAYVLRANPDEEMEFSLPGHLEFDFRPSTRWALEVRIADSAGCLARWGLETQDLVVGLDGAGFGSREDIEFALGEALEREAVLLDVARGAETLSISADPKKLVHPEFLGGALVPRRL
ncbi:MAG: carboxypeptidase-like regulatory domain-containing protein [Planctomycetota bacterium]